MNIPDRLPNPPMFEGSLCQKMTEEDWLEYFKCREKYDKPMTKEEKNKILAEASLLTKNGEIDKAALLAKKIPMKPNFAYRLKAVEGLKALKTFNLYEAKMEYPDEF